MVGLLTDSMAAKQTLVLGQPPRSGIEIHLKRAHHGQGALGHHNPLGQEAGERIGIDKSTFFIVILMCCTM